MDIKPLPVGVDDFEKLITRNYYFVDKTMFIKELLDKKGDVNLFTRPRRFGKSLNMSMLRYFFEDRRDENGQKVEKAYLFENMNIMKSGDEYLQHMGRYPVISLSLKSARQKNYENSYTMLVRAIAGEFFRHRLILESEKLAEKKERYLLLMREKAEPSSYYDSLRFLSECLFLYYGTNAIILIDEYDVPLESGYQNGYYDEMVDFIRSLFESALKTNLYLEFAVLTGCLPFEYGKFAKQTSEVSLSETLFTGMNNLKIISILNEKYDEYFGFTEKEVVQICVDYGLSHKLETIREWYNGYLFGSTNVYNPWSLIQFVDDLTVDQNCFPSSYWANTSSNSIVRSLIDWADRDVKDEIESLIAGGTIEKPVHEDITYDEVYANMDNLWNFMFFTGYFRKIQERMVERQRYITLKIPNEEVRYIFENKILGWFSEQIKKRDHSRLFRAFLGQDEETVRDEIEEMLMQTISFYDAYESFYHGFLAGILYGIDGYIVKSNREGGTGRTDLFIKPVSRRKTAYVVEFKVAGKYTELEEKAVEALKQIESKSYERELHDDGYASVIHYGISFFGKNCEVKIQE